MNNNINSAWKFSAISSAIAVVITGLSAPVTFAATQTLTGTQTFTVNSGQTVNGSSTTAIYVDSAAAGVTITNSGTVSANSGYAIYVDSGASNTTINNQNGGVISAGSYNSAIYFYDNLDGSINNAGQIISTDSRQAAGVYTSNDLTGIINNTGSISAIATALSSSANAFGIYVGNNLSGAIANSGTITAAATASTFTAEAYGIYVSNNLSGAITNSGTITATAKAPSRSDYAYGIYVGNDLTGTITNNGTINATATTNNPTGTDASAYGIYVGNDITSTGSIVNKGTISATAKSLGTGGSFSYGYGFAAGIYVSGNANGSIVNNGTISALVDHVAGGTGFYGTAYGIYVNGDVGATGSIVNTGTINAEAHAYGTSYPYAYGVYIRRGNLAGSLTNSGAITATAVGETSAYAYGVYVRGGDLSGSLANSGTITATANANLLNPASAYGIYVGNSVDGIITNSGSITATATAATSNASAYGIKANNISATGSIINSGTITASANSLTNPSNANAYGIYVNTLDGSIVNSGSITATARGSSSAFSIFAPLGSGTVDNSGSLNGNLLLGGVLGSTINLTNSGRVSIPNGGWVSGNYTQVGDGIYSATVKSATPGEYAQLMVGGTADLSANNRIGVKVTNDNTLANGDIIDNVLQAGTALVTGPALAVSDTSLPFNFTAINDGANGIDLTASATGLTTIAAAVGDGPGAGVAGVLDNLLNSDPSGDLLAVAEALGSSNNAAEVNSAVQQTLPSITAGLTQTALNNVHGTNRIINARQDAVRGASSGDAFLADKHFWLKPFGSRADQDNRNNAVGYGANTYGIALGVDGDISDANRIGLAFIYAHSNVDSDGADQSASIKSYQGALYGTHNLDENTYVDAQLDFTINRNDGKRDITFGGLNRSASADFDSYATHIGSSLGRVFDLNAKTTFTPSVRADYVFLRNEGYTEKGAGALNLKTGSSKTEELIVGVDGKLGYAFNDQTRLVGNLGVGYDVLSDDNAITSSFAGTPGAVFSTKGVDPSRWLVRSGLGLNMITSSAVQVTARYDLDWRDNFTDQTASLKVLLPF